jgi:HK97 family phage portal protein
LSDGTEFIESLINYLLISGNTFIEGTFFGNKKEPKELWTLRPDRMSVEMGRTGLPKAWTYKKGNLSHVYTMNEIDGSGPIRHLKLFNPLDDVFGMSPLQAAALSIDNWNQQGNWNLNLLQRGARPSGVLTAPDGQTLTPEQRNALKQDIQECYTGSTNAGKVMLLEGGMSWTDTQISPKDMDYTNAKSLTASDIATALGVPIQLLNIPGAQTYANFEQAMIFFYQFVVIPWAKYTYKNFDKWLLPSFGLKDHYFGLDLDQVEALEPLRKMKWDKAQNAQWLTINEKREMTGFGKYETKPDQDPADMILIDGGKMPLEFIDEEVSLDPITDPEDVDASTPPPKVEEEESDEITDTEDLEDEDEEGIDPESEEGKALLNVAQDRSLVWHEGKLFDLQKSASRRGYWLKQERRRIKFEQRMRNKVKVLFAQESALIASKVSNAEPGMQERMLEEGLRESSKQWEKVLGKEIKLILETYGKDIKDLEKSITPDDYESKLFGDFGFIGAFEAFVQKYSTIVVARKIKNIQKVSEKRVMKAVRQAIEDGIVDGQSNAQVAKQIQATYKGFSPARALTIARTETHSASQIASLESAKALELPDLVKEWVSAQDDRTREDHVVANGSMVEIDEKFIILDLDSGDEIPMDYPGDNNAPAKQVINCRCVAAYTTRKRR